MSFTIFLQVLANIVFTAALFVVFARLRRPAKDDPRLSKGLQLLSSKIAVLEDLSDRTETQVQQMLLLLDQKSKELQSKIALADQQVAAVRQSMEQSLEVAQIFQDKIPHNEIIERQNSVKYIKAARLAHAGVPVTDIAREVDLPMGEIEFIAKVNQDSLSFREEDLPAWAREPQSHVDHLSMAASITPNSNERMPIPGEANRVTDTHAVTAQLSPEQEGLVQKLSKLQFEMKNLDLELAHRANRNVLPDMTQAFEQPRVDSTSLERLGEEFRRAVEQAERAEQEEKEQAKPTIFGGPEFANPANSRTDARPDARDIVAAAPWRKIANETAALSQATAPAVNPELEAARAAAAALRAKDAPANTPTSATVHPPLVGAPHIGNPSHASPTTPQSPAKVVRRVEFPRI